MGKKKTEQKAFAPDISVQRILDTAKGDTLRFILGFILFLLGVYLFMALLSFLISGGADQSLVEHASPKTLERVNNGVKNIAGPLGARMAEYLINDGFGFASFLILIYMIVCGMKLIKAYRFNLFNWFLGCSVLMIWLSVVLAFAGEQFFATSFIYPGGMHGMNISHWLLARIGIPGLILTLLGIAIIYAVFITRKTIDVVRKALHPTLPIKRAIEPETTTMSDSVEEEEPTIQPTGNKQSIEEEPSIEPLPAEEQEVPVNPFPFQVNRSEVQATPQPLAQATVNEFTTTHLEEPVMEVEETVSETDNEPVFEIDRNVPSEDDAFRGDLSQPYNPRLDLEHYRFPTLDLLQSYEDVEPSIDMAEQKANKDRIVNVLRSFGIEISSIKASVGPTITLYEITPAEGVRIQKIRNLEDDIALSLAALGIRIIAPIPGKGTIGIEVPNANPQIVPMSAILGSKKFQESTFDLPVALGKTITNEVFMVDLAKAPHMLVAGATGQGKSVGLNAIVTSLLYKKHPSELKFVIIDPKKVEFAIYAPIERQFLAKLPDAEDAIITDVTKVVQTLNSLCVEMDTRYDLLRQAGCRNIKEYNAKFINRQLNPEKGHRFMPYIVIIIDEYGDLIMTAGKEVELPICRIAQLARAVGLHAIIATQRPTTSIITGTIKANFPARVAFKVASMIDSRTILDRSGAQQLIGKGDMLYLQNTEPVRVQCAFVDTPEVERIATFISEQQGYPSAFMLPEYVDENEDGSSLADVDMNKLDPMFEEAARLLIYHQQGSTSLIQRKFSIGYNRAGRIMDQLEKAGIVGPANGSKARDVLCIDENDLQNKLDNLKN